MEVTEGMTDYVSVCKNVIASNNRHNWCNPAPAIRVSVSRSGNAVRRAHVLAIMDKEGNEVARVISTTDGKPVIKCGAKVAIVTEYPTEVIE